jgi:hypothetical protein
MTKSKSDTSKEETRDNKSKVAQKPANVNAGAKSNNAGSKNDLKQRKVTSSTTSTSSTATSTAFESEPAVTTVVRSLVTLL